MKATHINYIRIEMRKKMNATLAEMSKAHLF